MRARPPESPAPLPLDGDPRVARLIPRVAERLRPVCAGWEEARFQQLVRQIARLKVSWGEADHLDA